MGKFRKVLDNLAESSFSVSQVEGILVVHLQNVKTFNVLIHESPFSVHKCLTAALHTHTKLKWSKHAGQCWPKSGFF